MVGKLKHVSMGRKLSLLLLAVGLVPLSLVVWLGGLGFEEALMEKAAAQLKAVRQIKTSQIEEYFQRHRQDVAVLVDTVGTLGSETFMKLSSIRDDRKAFLSEYLHSVESQILTFAQQKVVQEAARDFRQSAPTGTGDKLLDAHRIQTMRRELAAYYHGEFDAEYRRRNDGGPSPAGQWLGALDEAAIVLQYRYISANPHPLGHKHLLNTFPDGSSDYDKVHAQVHPVFRDYLKRFGFYDIFLIDPENGRIVYSVFKELDFATSLKDGPLADSSFAMAWRKARRIQRPGSVVSADLSSYGPSYNDPAGFILTPVFDQGEMLGILAFQISIERLNAIMTRRDGLGRSGETYLVGPDKLMRSNAYSDPQHHSVMASFRDPSRGRADTDAVRQALSGQTDMRVIVDYQGNHVLSAWTPVSVMGFNWALVAEIDMAEAFVPESRTGASFLSRYRDKFGYRDILLIHPDGQVLHSVVNRTLRGENLLQEPHANSPLGNLMRRVLASRKLVIADLENTDSNNKTPSYFIAQSGASENGVDVIVALEISFDAIDHIMNQRDGMSETGVTFLVGRNNGELSYRNRRIMEPARIGETDAETVTYGERPVNGQTGTTVGIGRGGEQELVDFAPLKIPGLNWAIIGTIRVDEVKKPVNDLQRFFFALGLALAGVIAIISLFSTRSIVQRLLDLQHAANAIAAGDLSTRSHLTGEDEVGRVGSTFDVMAQRIEEQNWLNTNLAHVVGILQQVDALDQLADRILSEIIVLLQAGQGVFHLLDASQERFQPLGRHRGVHREGWTNGFAFGEGLVGRCALEGRALVLSDIPDEAIRLGYGLGEAQPLSVIVVPIGFQDQTLAVLEIVSLQAFTPIQTRLLEEMGQRLGVALVNLKQAQETRKLLEETQRQAEELRSRTKELEASQTELRRSNESLEKQTQALQTSEEELKAQQEELRSANEALEERTKNLRNRTLELESARADLERASRIKSEFLANMSHELRTPLNSLLILASGLADNELGNLTGEQMRDARIVHESGQDLLNLINEILDLSKIEAGRMEVHSENLAISTIATSMEKRFRPVAREKGLTFTVTTSPEAPEAFSTDWSKADRIVGNLLANAFKFTRRGEVSLRFYSSFEEGFPTRGRSMSIAVKDTGIGIPKDKQGIIFEAFRQGEGGASREFGGTGLGLSIALRLATMLGGRIELDSIPDQGSLFTLHLPELLRGSGNEMNAAAAGGPDNLASTAAIDKVEACVAGPSAADGSGASGAHDRVILVIEDDPRLARIVSDLARKRHFKCLNAADAREGLELAKRHLPTGIILDMKLSKADGGSVLDQLKGNVDTRSIPVHIVSTTDEVLDDSENGATGDFSRPITLERLQEVFQRLEGVAGQKVRRLLLVEDDPRSRLATAKLMSGVDVVIAEAATGEEAMALLKKEPFDCMILDLGLPDISGFELLDRLTTAEGVRPPPVIVYSGRELTREEYDRLKRHTDSIVVKGMRSAERLLDEVVLFLHRVEKNLPDFQQNRLIKSRDRSTLYQGKTVLVAEDDVRSAYALSRNLEAKGMNVFMAANGQKALERLDEHPEVDVVLMDIMMPVMDGLEAIRRIRAQEQFRTLPVIALTAKAMTGDREKCLAVGASDYLPKPVDMERLFSMLRVWLYQ
ncbi:MAG: response regulator [Magnetococcales bacterium]|nr:response regulator [Magnetococcales bacterium]